MTFSGGSYTGATTVTEGALNLSFNKRAISVAAGSAGDFYNRASRVILNGGNLAVTGRAAASAVTRNFTVGGNGLFNRCARGGNTAALVAGMKVTGANIPAETYVVSIKDGSRLMLNKTASNDPAAVVSLTFGMVNDTTWQTINAVELQQSAAINVNNNGGAGTTLLAKSVTVTIPMVATPSSATAPCGCHRRRQMSAWLTPRSRPTGH
jgi:hypothetical protein